MIYLVNKLWIRLKEAIMQTGPTNQDMYLLRGILTKQVMKQLHYQPWLQKKQQWDRLKDDLKNQLDNNQIRYQIRCQLIDKLRRK